MHTAFLVMVYNEKNELLIAKRSPQKMLWPGFWDGSVASHYFHDHAPLETIKKRLKEEIGVFSDRLEYLFKFRYRARFENLGSENEICDVFRASGIRSKAIAVNPAEISEYGFLSPQNLRKELNKNLEKYTPWLVLAMKKKP